MGKIESAQMTYGLSATGTHEKTLVTGSTTIGTNNVRDAWADADIAYAFTIESLANLGEGTLELISGTVTNQADVTVVDGDGKDFEGDTLQPMATLYGITFSRGGTPVDSINIAAQNTNIGTRDIDETVTAILPSYFTSGLLITAGSDDIVFTFQAAGDSLTVTVIGRST